MDHAPQTMYQGRFLRLVADGHWEYAQRTNAAMAVGIIAVTPAGELVLVTQHRIPVQRTVVEIPAGLVGDGEGQADESLLDAAGRELLEETGFEAAKLEIVVDAVSSAGMTDEGVTLVLATGLRRIHAGGGDASEAITVHCVPVDEVVPWVAERQAAGAAVDVKVFAAVFFATRWLAASPANGA